MKKNMLKGWIPTVGMIAVMLMGTTFANAGVVYGVKSDDNQPCNITEKVDSGVVYGFTGVVYGFTGVVYGLTGVVYGLISTPPAECGTTKANDGIIIKGDGIIVAE